MITKTEKSSENEFFLLGISVRTTNKDGQAAKDIGGLWTRFMSENLMGQITDRVSDDLYCAYTDYETDFTGPYTAVLGCRVNSLNGITGGFTGITVPAGDYLVHHLGGEFPANIGTAWQQIWASDIDRKYAADYDLYRAGARSFEETEARIYVGVR